MKEIQIFSTDENVVSVQYKQMRIQLTVNNQGSAFCLVFYKKLFEII